MKRGVFIFVIFLSLLGSGFVFGFSNEMLTFADFNRVRYISTSISHVYFATTEGVIRYNKIDKFWEDPLTSGEGIDNRDIHRVWVDQFDDYLYVQTSDGYYQYELIFDRWLPVDSVPFNDINYSHIRPSAMMYPPPGFNFSQEGILIDPTGRDFLFTDMVDDLSGRVWLGTWGYGAAVSGSSSGIIDLIPFGLIQNDVAAIHNDKGTLLTGGDIKQSLRTGVTIFDPDENCFEYIESGVEFNFPQDDINCLEADDDYIYIGSNSGLYVWNRELKEIHKKIGRSSGLPDDIILSLSSVGDSILVGTTEGLCYVTSGSDSLGYIRPDRFVNHEIYDIETTDSTLWIGASNGVYQLRLGSDKLQQFQDPHSIVFDRAYQIERYENTLWMASDGGFISLDLKTGDTRAFPSISRGYSSRALAVNDIIVAAASERGFRITYHKDPERLVEREFTVDDGLPSGIVKALLLDGDYLWVGTDRGLSLFLWNDPHRVD